ncbi:MAG: hypothetical protein ACTS44_01710 [Candidatus Hodgkinia cicadicola]
MMGKFLGINVTQCTLRPEGSDVKVVIAELERRLAAEGWGKVGGKHDKWCKLRVMVQLA